MAHPDARRRHEAGAGVSVEVIHADSRDALATMAEASIDSVVCDPPYALTSMTLQSCSSKLPTP